MQRAKSFALVRKACSDYKLYLLYTQIYLTAGCALTAEIFKSHKFGMQHTLIQKGKTFLMESE